MNLLLPQLDSKMALYTPHALFTVVTLVTELHYYTLETNRLRLTRAKARFGQTTALGYYIKEGLVWRTQPKVKKKPYRN